MNDEEAAILYLKFMLVGAMRCSCDQEVKKSLQEAAIAVRENYNEG